MNDEDTGYSITLKELVSLLTNESWRDKAKPVIESSLNCTVAPNGLSLTTASGEAMKLEDAHVAIQSDPVKQRRIYNLAMSLWQ